MKTRSHAAEIAAALGVGLLFGAGLLVSGMADPRKVLGFLDLAGAWDPSLALVMAGAVLVGLLGFAASAKRAQSVLGLPMRLPANRRVDLRVVTGSVIFGVGWGLAGFCPGPALVALGSGSAKALLFVAAMLAGMALYEAFDRRARSQARARLT